MKVSLSPLIGDARGTAGGLSLFLSRAGMIAKINGMPYDPRTAAQLLVRASLVSLSQTWKGSIMNPYRSAWILLSHANPYQDTFGVTRYLSGAAFFIKLNRNLATIGVNPIFPAPVSVACGAPGLLTLSHIVGPPEHFYVTPTNPPAAGEAVVIRATKPLSPGVLTLSNAQTVIQTFPAGTPGPWDIMTDYAKKHTTRTPGNLVFVLVNYVQATTGFAGQQSIDSLLW